MNDYAVSFVPALTFLGLLAFLALALYWARKRMFASAGGAGTNLRMVSQLALGAQQRVAVVEIISSRGPVHLVLGITPQQISTLHVLPIDPKTDTTQPDHVGDGSSYREIAQALAPASQELRS